MADRKIAKMKTKPEWGDVYSDLLEDAHKFVTQFGHIPSVNDLARFTGKIRSSIRHHFNEDADLLEGLLESYPEITNEIINMDDLSLSTFKNLLKKISKKRRFIVTAAEVGKPLWNDGKAVQTILQWCKKRDALPLLIPIGNDVLRLHKAFKSFGLILQETYLNSNIMLSHVQTTTTAQNPSSGLSKITGQNKTSTIFGATKLSKTPVATDMGKMPHFLFTTGCVTNADYKRYDKLMPSKVQHIAEFDHEISAIIVEVKNDKTFFTKIAQFDTDGSMIEVTKKGAKRYFPNGDVKSEYALNFNVGDSHVEEADPVVEAKFIEIAGVLKPETVSLHDVFSYEGPGHHTKDDIIAHAKMFEKQWNFQKDLTKLNVLLNKYSRVVRDKVYVVGSNHDEHIAKAIKTDQLRKAPTYRIFLELSLAMLDGHNPLKWALEKYTGFKSNKVHFLNDRERHVLKNKRGELALHHHGHQGANGAKGGSGTGKGSLAMSVGCANIGHAHSPCVIPGGSENGYGNGGIWVNGTSTYCDDRAPDYVFGAGSWFNTSTATFMGSANGRFIRTQIDLINGEWCLD